VVFFVQSSTYVMGQLSLACFVVFVKPGGLETGAWKSNW